MKGPEKSMEKDTDMQTIQVPDEVAENLVGLSKQQMKQRIITPNGLTIAQEEEILRRSADTDGLSGPMTPEEFLNELRSHRNENQET